MSAHDKAEKILREMHVMLSKSEVYEEETNRVIIDKKKMLELLQQLNVSVYEIMDEYEMTQQSRDKAERAARKQGEEIVWDASKKAEDVYAASVLYTDEALADVQDIMQEAMDSIKEVYQEMEEKLKQEKRRVRTNQSELKGHLQDLQDTEKYLKIIEDCNRKAEKEKRKREAEQEQEMYSYKSIKPDIKINQEYFEEHGIPFEEESKPEEKKEDVMSDIKVNLDAEYFQWKEQEGEPEESKKEAAKEGSFKKFLLGKK
ncbi:MAG: hypothetical protein ACI4ES_07955 [Roseburia sp.]